MKFKTPSGTPASRNREKSCQPFTGETLEGLYNTVFPATSAAETIPAEMASGKFQGATTSATPLGW